MNIKEIISPINTELQLFEQELKKAIDACDNFLKTDLENFIFSSSKRLRPIFVFSFAKILELKHPDIQKIALALELIHSASLIHDDIIDEEKTRRSHPAFHSKHGAKLAVLEGDLLLSLALKILSETKQEVTKIFADKIFNTINGEIEQNSALFCGVNEDEYIKKSLNKTGNLFMAGLESVLCFIKCPDAVKKALLDFMMNYSIAFQVKNDIKDICEDTKLGNYTLVVLYYLKENDISNILNSDLTKYIKMAEDKALFYKNRALYSLGAIEKTENTSRYIKMLEELVDATL